MWCLKCGEKEPGDQEKCRICEYPIGTPDNRLYLHQMMRITGDLLCGNIDKTAFDKVITNSSKMLDEMHKGLLGIEKKLDFDKLPEAGKNVMSRPMNSFKEGIEIFSDGLDELRLYLVDPEEEHLRKGLKLIEKANNTMYYCFEVSQFAMREIERFFPEYETISGEEIQEDAKGM